MVEAAGLEPASGNDPTGGVYTFIRSVLSRPSPLRTGRDEGGPARIFLVTAFPGASRRPSRCRRPTRPRGSRTADVAT